MPFIQSAIADAKEAEVVPEGPYDLRIISADTDTSKKGNNMVVCLIGIDSSEHPNAQPITEYLVIPADDDEYKHLHLLKLARFLHAFSIPHEDTGFDTDDFPGSTASGVRLTQEMVDKDKDGNPRPDPFPKNVAQWPRLPKEERQEQPQRKAGG